MLARSKNRSVRIAVDKTCKLCGVVFQDDTLSKIKLYCSPECSKVAVKARKRTPPSNKACEVCGKMYYGAKGSRYCSRDCTASAKHSKAKPRTCKTCGKVFIPERAGSVAFCSDECKPKQPEKCAHCGGPMPPLPTGTRPMVYCGAICKHAAMLARAKENIEKQKAENRKRLAKGLRMWRNGATTQEITTELGIKEPSFSSFMRGSKGYRRKTSERIKKSRWHETETTRNARSKAFRIESEFRRYAAGLFERNGFHVREEVPIPGTRRRIDLIVQDGVFRFGIELKNGNRTARLDQTLGQAIVKCNAFGGLIPVCAVPDDVRCDKVFLAGCASVNAIAGTATECLNQIRIRCYK